MKTSHGSLWKTLSIHKAISSLQDGNLPHPSFGDLVHILLTCRKEKDHAHALGLHAYILRQGLETHAFLGNYLVSMLVENKIVHNAQLVFDGLVHPNEWSWNALINGYIKCGKPQHAFTVYHNMQKDAFLQPSVYTFVALLKACAKLKDLEKGAELHGNISAAGFLETNTFVGSALVSMYAKCGVLDKARQVFDVHLIRDVVIWTTLIAGYIEDENGESALQCFEQMQCEGVIPDSVTLLSILKACSTIGGTKKGQEIHVRIEEERLLETNNVFGSALVDMYAKCGSLAKAQRVFEELSSKDVVSWNALISGYVDHRYGEKALDCFKQMKSEGIHPNPVTFVSCLKACISIGTIDEGQEIHAELDRQGLVEQNLFIGSTLVDMYGNFGLLSEAQHVFDKICGANVVSWTALISGYADHGFGQEALSHFQKMQLENVTPNSKTFVCVLQACGNLGATHKGIEVNAEIGRRGLLHNVYVGSALVDMYSKCGLLAKARDVFDKLPVQDIVSWNALIVGYTENGQGEEALECYEQMKVKGVSPNDVTSLCSLKACGSVGAVYKGIEIHADIERQGLLLQNPFFGSSVIDMYANCFLLAKSQEVFDKLPSQDLVSWNTLISGYAEKGYGEKALKCYEQMQLKGVCPDAATFICALKACGIIGAADKSQELHAEIERQGLLERDAIVGNVLVDTLAKCNLIAVAQQVFDKLPFRNVVAWTALTAGYAEHGHGAQALKCFEQMQLEGVAPNALTFASCLKACGSIRALDKGQEIHGVIERKGLLEGDLVIGNVLIDMYAKFGLPATAKQVFDTLEVRDTVSWTALIAGFAEHGQDKEALKCFEQMQLEDVSPDALALVCSLQACGNVGALDKGEEIHCEIERRGILMKDLVVGNTLVDMYAKCGSLTKAQKVFDRLPARNVVSWTAMMAGYAQLGDGENACATLNKMIGEGIKPDPVTFVVVLSACSRSGLFDKSQTYYEAMSEDYGIVPMLEHQTCVVDSLGRAGQLDKVVSIMERLPLHDVVEMWHTVLGTCRISGNLEFGQHAFEHTMWLDKKVSSAPDGQMATDLL